MLKFPAPKLEVYRNLPRLNCPQTTAPPLCRKLGYFPVFYGRPKVDGGCSNAQRPHGGEFAPGGLTSMGGGGGAHRGVRQCIGGWPSEIGPMPLNNTAGCAAPAVCCLQGPVKHGIRSWGHGCWSLVLQSLDQTRIRTKKMTPKPPPPPPLPSPSPGYLAKECQHTQGDSGERWLHKGAFSCLVAYKHSCVDKTKAIRCRQLYGSTRVPYQ